MDEDETLMDALIWLFVFFIWLDVRAIKAKLEA